MALSTANPFQSLLKRGGQEAAVELDDRKVRATFHPIATS
jgi:hypothetical protein